MIVRVWRAEATIDGAEKYRRHFEQNVMPELRGTAGFQKAYLLNHEQDGTVAIEVHTLWESLDAIRAFAKPDLTAAVVEPESHGKAFVLSPDQTRVLQRRLVRGEQNPLNLSQRSPQFQ